MCSWPPSPLASLGSHEKVRRPRFPLSFFSKMEGWPKPMKAPWLHLHVAGWLKYWILHVMPFISSGNNLWLWISFSLCIPGEAAARADHIEVSVVVFPIMHGIDKRGRWHIHILSTRPAQRETLDTEVQKLWMLLIWLGWYNWKEKLPSLWSGSEWWFLLASMLSCAPTWSPALKLTFKSCELQWMIEKAPKQPAWIIKTCIGCVAVADGLRTLICSLSVGVCVCVWSKQLNLMDKRQTGRWRITGSMHLFLRYRTNDHLVVLPFESSCAPLQQ